jgi:hypothetical protein
MATLKQIGKRMVLWTEDGHAPGTAQHLVITSHGAYFRRPFVGKKQGTFGGYYKAPAGTTLIFYTPHGQVLVDPGLMNFMDGTNVPNAVDVVNGGELYRNYALWEYITPMNGQQDAENQREIRKFMDKMTELREGNPTYPRYDVLSLMTSNWNYLMLSTLLKKLQGQGYNYSVIHCVFCRNGKNMWSVNGPVGAIRRLGL